MPKIYFFSDAHLGIGTKEEDRSKERSIVRFLDRVALDGEQLFIVGDLFDYWFEYKTVVPKGYFRLFARLADLTENGIAVSYVAGNHDLWVKTYFRDELGIQVYHDPIERRFHGKRFYIHHGDGLLKNDRGYRLLKKVFRNRACIFLFSLLHPDFAARIARWSSHTSRKHTSNRSFEESDMVEFAQSKIQEGYDVVVMGHHHQAMRRNLASGTYVNLGEWIEDQTYAVFDGTDIQLHKWSTS